MKLDRTLLRGATAASIFAFGATSAQATVLFQDDFNNDYGSTQLNVGSLTNWTIAGGTVDYVRNTNYGITCLGAAGGCLDMDGSTLRAGRITSVSTFDLIAGVNYTLSAYMSGNQRSASAGPDTVRFGLLDTGSNILTSNSTGGLISSAGYSLFSLAFTPGANLSTRLFFQGSGGDNIGVIADNIRLSTVPEPGAITLLIALGIGMLALRGRRAT